MSFNLWFDLGRSFPRAPILSGFTLRQDFVISGALVVMLVVSTITVRPRGYLAAVVVLSILLVSLDQTRLQPWVYQYSIVLTLLFFASHDESYNKAIVAANQIVVATLYFWSGLHKLSSTFFHDVAPRLIELIGFRLSSESLTIIAAGIAICETLIGIGLLLRRTRQLAVVLACLVHAIILFTLIFLHINTVVWPWNVAMMLMTVVLFWRNDESPFAYLIRRQSNGPAYLPQAAMLICGLLPALSFIGLWDLYLSGALYSGKSPIAVMRISESTRERLPVKAQELTFKTSRGELILPFYEWSIAELNVPPYPEERAYRQIARQLCTLDSDPQANALIIKAAHNYKPAVITCSDLLAK